MKRAIAIWAFTASACLAQSTVTGSKTMQGSWDATGATATKPAKSGSTLPSTCTSGEFFFNTSAAAGQNLYLCQPANTWTQVSSGVNSIFGRTGVVAAQSSDYSFSQIGGTVSSGQLPAAGGDLSGTLGSATVKGIQGKTVSATAPTSGQVLVWNGTQWVPQTLSSSLGGDLSGTTAAATVQGIQGRSLSTTVPAAGQVLTWTGSVWQPQTPSSGGGGGGSSTSQTIVFDGSTTTLADGSTVAWSSCSTNAKCATWTVPSNVFWVRVETWAGGGPGLGATAGSGGPGGAGGGYGNRTCMVTGGTTVTVQVGLGGITGAGFGSNVTQGGDSAFGTCIGATASLTANQFAAGNTPGVMKVNGVVAPPGPWFLGNGFWNILTGVSSGATSPSASQTPGYDAGREDQGGWPGSGWQGGTGAGLPAGLAIGGGGGGGGGAAQNAVGGAAGTSLYGGAGGAGGSSATACTAGSIPGGGGGGSFVPASGSVPGCNGARGEVRVYYVH